MPTLPVRSLGYPVSNQNRGRNADRPKAPATRESCFEFWSWGAEAEGGKARRARQGPGRVQCDTFLELRGRDIPFLKQPTIRFVQRSTGGGNATKQNSLNSLLYPGQRQNIKSAGLLLEISVEWPSLDLLLLFPHEYKYFLHLPYVTHALPQTPPPLPCWAACKSKVCPPLNREGRGRREQCCLRDNVTFLFVKILCQLLGK